jgi:hypothetical protein
MQHKRIFAECLNDPDLERLETLGAQQYSVVVLYDQTRM